MRHREIKLELSWKLPPCWLAFILPECTLAFEGDVSSAALLICEPYMLSYQLARQNMATQAIVTSML